MRIVIYIYIILFVGIILFCGIMSARTFCIDYKKLRVYISPRTIDFVEESIMKNSVECEWKYRTINIEDHLYYFCFFNGKQEEIMRYDIKVLREQNYTIILARYNKHSIKKPMKFELLDNFILRKTGAELK